ncbi:MAG: hypothetical protein AB1351_13690 [Thermoproteota archaeon]
MDALWDGPDPTDRSWCPYPVNFECTPAPADTLNSLESGRLLLEVMLGRGIKSVSAKIVNNAKMENLGKIEGTSDLKHMTVLLAKLVPDGQQPGRWSGELRIPVSWVEGGTRTYERTGAANPKSERNLYTLEITYALENGNNCTARFFSEDVFHWQPQQRSAV